MIRKNMLISLLTLLVFSLIVAGCGGGQVVEKVVTVEVEKVVTVEVEKEVEKIVTVEVEAEVAEATEEAAAAEEVAEATEEAAPAETTQQTTAPAAQEGATLAQVRERGVLLCGGNANLAGFGRLDPDGQYVGFDIDFCRAVAAAVLGDADAIEVRQTTATDRFPVLQSGEIDMLSRNTTWTISRDTSLGFNFAPVTFYDGQGMMVRRDSGVTQLTDLEGATVCVSQGTTTEKNLADVMRALGVNYEPVVIQTTANEDALAYDEGRCDAFTTDKSGLVSIQTILQNPDEHIILDETMSKEPLGPLVRHGDDQWFDIVKWVTFGLFQAEELGITAANVEEMAATSEDPVIRNLLGVEGDLGQGLGLDNDFMVKAISQVGNYGEIYDKHLGPDTVYNLPRGLNAQWTEGGLIYSPPFR
jgi:general L-amino acid transport system substrate-binding protein